jgi:hypothetical protein
MNFWRARFSSIAMAMLLGWLFLFGNPALATPATGQLSERIAQFPAWDSKPPVVTAQGDLIYPEWFAGEWIVSTTLRQQVAPLAPDITTPGFESNRQYLNHPVRFRVRFTRASDLYPSSVLSSMPFLASGAFPSSIIADRAFNSLHIARAYLDAMQFGHEQTTNSEGRSSQSRILFVKVDPHNPNRQVTLLRGPQPGTYRQLTSTITGRATEAPMPNRFLATEVFQQEFRGIPQPYFNIVETTTDYHYHPHNTPEITADQMTAIYLSPLDADYFKAGDTPVALYHYQLEFTRMQ